MFKVPEQYRVTTGIMGSTKAYGTQGVFIIPVPEVEDNVKYYQVIASSGLGWEHVSVTLIDDRKCPVSVMPSWEDMCSLKDEFWDDMDCVVQFHPPKSEYVNNHRFCLHLWRPTNQVLPMPDSILVGLKGVSL